MKLVIDLSYYIKHRDISDFYTVSDVVKESLKSNMDDFEAKSIIKSVPKEYINYVKNIARDIGILDYLSKGDIKLCALGYYFLKNNEEVLLLTNDLYLQNLCYFVGVPFDGDKKIKYAKIFEYVCENCNTRGKEVICPKCGKLRKRVVKKVIKVKS